MNGNTAANPTAPAMYGPPQHRSLAQAPHKAAQQGVAALQLLAVQPDGLLLALHLHLHRFG